MFNFARCMKIIFNSQNKIHTRHYLSGIIIVWYQFSSSICMSHLVAVKSLLDRSQSMSCKPTQLDRWSLLNQLSMNQSVNQSCKLSNCSVFVAESEEMRTSNPSLNCLFSVGYGILRAHKPHCHDKVVPHRWGSLNCSHRPSKRTIEWDCCGCFFMFLPAISQQRHSVLGCPCPSVCVWPCAIITESLWTQYLKTTWKFRQIYNEGRVSDTDELVGFWDQKVKGQSHDKTRRGRKLLVQKCTFPVRACRLTVRCQRPSMVVIGAGSCDDIWKIFVRVCD